MATMEILNQNDHYAFDVWVHGLQYYIYEYDKFVLRVLQNDVCIIKMTESLNDGSALHNFTWRISNENYLGYNWLSPDCQYEVYVDCYYEGQCYPLGPETLTTPSINPPSGTISPQVYVPIRDQGMYNTCVADALACAMEIFRAKNVGVKYERFSTAYIYGGEGSENNYTDEGMNNESALRFCRDYGSPRYEIFSGYFPDSTWKDTAIDMYNNNTDTIVKENAKKQRLSSIENIDFYDCSTIASRLDDFGFFMFSFLIPENFHDVGSDGIVPQPDKSTGMGHSMALIGLTQINGKPHWIAQNSWGEDWGDGGRCYIPYDWGCGVQAPVINSKKPTSWTGDCYSARGTRYEEGNPEVPYNIYGRQLDINRNLMIGWSSDEGSSTQYIILARAVGTEQWYRKDVVNTTTATINVDYGGDYEFMIIAIDDYFCSDQSDIFSLTIVGYIPYWEWSTRYVNSEDPDGPPISIDYNAYIPMDETGFHPVTAVEWNSFTELIEQVRVFLGYEKFGFTQVQGASTGHSDNPTAFTIHIYNEAEAAIRVLSEELGTEYWGGPMEGLGSLYPDWFIWLQDGLNCIIDKIYYD